MPIFDYKCDCGNIERNIVRRNSEDDTSVYPCSECSELADRYWGETQLMFDRVFGAADMEGYHCPVTDDFVTSRKQRREIMKEHNLEEVGGSDRKTLGQRRKELGHAPPSARPDSKLNDIERKKDVTRTVQEMWR